MSFDMAKYCRERYERLVRAGLCPTCTKTNNTGFRTCAACRKRARSKQVERRVLLTIAPPPPDMAKVVAFVSAAGPAPAATSYALPPGIEWERPVTIVRTFEGHVVRYAQTRDKAEAERQWNKAREEVLAFVGPIRVSLCQGMKTFLTIKRRERRAA